MPNAYTQYTWQASKELHIHMPNAYTQYTWQVSTELDDLEAMVSSGVRPFYLRT